MSKPNIDVTKIILGHGAHSKPETVDEINTKVCALEWVSILAGEEKFSDHPQCACPVIASFVRSWNDAFPDSVEGDAQRTELIRPLLPLLLNSRVKNDKVLLRRSYLAIDWVIRTHAPAFLKLAKLDEHAQALSAELEVDCLARLKAIEPIVSAADSAAYSAADSAADSAAYSAARSAAQAALAPVVKELQLSAQDLVRRMVAVTPETVENWDWTNGQK